jgi:sulfite dehydrogenase (cytochrome) subunit B
VWVRIRGFVAGLVTVGALPAAASESDIVLANDPGRAQVQAACSMCHSLDYIVMNSPIQDQAGWEKTVKKMVAVYGAPLTAEESAAIIAYLASHYGK